MGCFTLIGMKEKVLEVKIMHLLLINEHDYQLIWEAGPCILYELKLKYIEESSFGNFCIITIIIWQYSQETV